MKHGNIEVKWNPAGYRAFNNSDSVQRMLREIAEQVAERANQSLPSDAETRYEADVKTGPRMARARAKAIDAETIRHNSKTNALLKGLRG